MKTTFFITSFCFAFLICNELGYSQWIKVNGPKFDEPIAFWATAQKGDTILAGTYRSTIFRSFDDGNTWVEVKAGLPVSFYEAYTLLIVQEMVFAGSDKGIYRSTDWGEHWTLQTGALLNVVSLAYTDSTLFAVTQDGIFDSRDMGNTWKSDNAGFPTDSYGNVFPMNSIVIDDSLILVGCRDGVYRKIVGDSVWKSSNLGLPFDGKYHLQARCVSARGAQVFLGTGHCAGSIYFSSNFGESWTWKSDGMPTNSSGCYLDVFSFASKDSLILAGTGYGMFRSTNNGKKWQQFSLGLPLGSASDLYIPSIRITLTDFVASTFGGVYRLPFGQSTWTPLFIHYPAIVHYSILAASGNNLFTNAYADYFNGEIYRMYRSTNEGLSWIADSSLVMNNTSHYFNIGKQFYAAGFGLYVSSDDGSHWKEIDSGMTFVNALVSNDTTMFAAYGIYYLNSDMGAVYRSTNDGLSWELVGLKYIPVVSLAMIGKDVVAQAKGLFWPNSLYRTTDNGFTWLEIDSLLPPGVKINSLSALDGSLFIATNHGVFLSNDLGTSWEQKSNGLPKDSIGSFFPVSILYLNNTIPAIANVLFAAGSHKLFTSDNKGTAWREIDTSLFGQMVSITADRHNLVVSTDTEIWRRPLSELTAVNSQSAPIPFTFKLEQNYPNPFNPSTTISYDLPNRTQVTIKVFNLLGQEIAILVRGLKEAGRHFVQWDASSFTSGIYFCRLETQGVVDTKKLVVLK